MKSKLCIGMICLLGLVLNLYASSSKDDSYESLKVVRMGVVVGTVKNPDVFFEGTCFESVKPTRMLANKSKYDKINDDRNMTNEQRIKNNNPNNIKSKISRYQITKSEDDYVFRFNSQYRDDVLTGKTVFVNDNDLNNYAKNLSKKNSIVPINHELKIYKNFTKTEFDAMPKQILQETADFIETICLIDQTYVYIAFRKIYE